MRSFLARRSGRNSQAREKGNQKFGHAGVPGRDFRKRKRPADGGVRMFWRRGPESNRPTRICNPVHNRFATAPWGFCCRAAFSHNGCRPAFPMRPHKTKGKLDGFPSNSGAGDESRTRDLNLGKVALYQLSYSRIAFGQVRFPTPAEALHYMSKKRPLAKRPSFLCVDPLSASANRPQWPVHPPLPAWPRPSRPLPRAAAEAPLRAPLPAPGRSTSPE
jgi:hypothetical protein